MGKTDTVTKNYVEDCQVFADVFNYSIYNGRQMIDPKKLHPLDTSITSVPYGTDDAWIPVQKYRDGLKYWTAMEDGNATYLLLGIESQADIHYAMPVKNMVYDALQYARQVEEAASSHSREQKKRKQLKKDFSSDTNVTKPYITSGEYLTGFYKDDKLIPVITQVIFFNPDMWDGPMSLHEMLAVQDENILSLVPNYSINLIAPAEMTTDEINKFSSSLREVLLYIKYSKDKDKLAELVSSDSDFRSIDRKAVRVINTVTNSKLNIEDNEEEVDMCKAIDDMRNEAWENGLSSGRVAGKAEIILMLLEEIGKVPSELTNIISKQQSVPILNAWAKLAAKATSISDFQRQMNSVA